MTDSRDVALIVGVDRNEHLSTGDLSCAEADAGGLRDLFRHLRLRPERIITLVGASATRERVMSEVAALPGRFPELDPGDRVWVCFSGHGVVDPAGRAHLLLRDTTRESGGFRDSLIVEELLDRLQGGRTPDRRPNIVMLMDACRQRVPAEAKDIGMEFQDGLRRLLQDKASGAVVFFACPDGQVSYEDHERGLGFFTGAFIDVMTAADRPRTPGELAYALQKRIAGRIAELGRPLRQTPTSRTEPAELDQGLLLAPHLLTPDDLAELRERARYGLDPLPALALWTSLGRLLPDDEDIRQRIGRLVRDGVPRQARSTPANTGLDLGTLHDTLRAGRWRDADRETLRLLLTAAGRDPVSIVSHLLSPQDIAKISVSDLWAVDDVWRMYSRGRFGFTAQREALGQADGDSSVFADRVGWRRTRWIWYSEATWSSTAPAGHLPILGPAGGVRPPWRLAGLDRARAVVFPLESITALGRQVVDPTWVSRLADSPVTPEFGWRQYAGLAASAWADMAKGVRRGRLRPMRDFAAEAPLRKLFTQNAQLLSVVWAITRRQLLARLDEAR